MTDIAVTATAVVPVSGYSYQMGITNVAVTQGQTVYLDSASGQWKLAKANLVGAYPLVGIALNAASAGQPLQVLTGGNCTFNAVLTKGVVYVLSGANAGGIAPLADLTTGWDFCVVGLGTSTTNMLVAIKDAAVTM